MPEALSGTLTKTEKSHQDDPPAEEDMNISQCKKITFAYTEASYEDVLYKLKIKAALDKTYSLHAGTNKINDIFVVADKCDPQIYNSKILKAIFLPCKATCGTMMISNIQDGWRTLCFQLSTELEKGFYVFDWTDTSHKNVINSFTYIENGEVLRAVYSMKDPRWIFYQTGEPMRFENTTFYDNKIKSKRINKSIILDYCKYLNLDLDNINFMAPSKSAILSLFSD
ncbi:MULTISPECIES: hypothetical protein [Pseudomonas]|uniref:hypothetical protein n=1 Tax=Pseudomonas TaxID=286 RepID=UPI00190A5BCA|nr:MULTISPECIES: hypothetical protein [Pseudomonas]MBK3476433.1 hypothetical protein [Pseudomonas sp. MF6751]MBL4980924.1 hypothetical protein [Pseudomonas fluorescens]